MGGWLLSLLSLFVCFINARFVRFNQILEEHDNRNTPRTVKSEGMQAILLSLTGKPRNQGPMLPQNWKTDTGYIYPTVVTV